jgi:hypothetical protein
VVVDVAAVALTVVVVAVAVAVLSIVAASATSLARRSLSTKRIASRACRGLYESAKITKRRFVGFCLDY